MKVVLYGRLRDSIGREIDVEAAEDCSVGRIREQLATRFPAAGAALRRSRSVIGDRTVADEQVLGPDDILEFLPPVSGG